MSSTRLKLKKGFVLNAYKEDFLIRPKNEIFLQVNAICIRVRKEAKVRVNDNSVFVGESEIQLSLRVSWKRKRTSSEYNLIVKIHKDGSVLNRG